MTQSNYVISDTPEDLNREHKVTLTEGQISTILYIMEGYIQGSEEYMNEPQFELDVDTIFGELEGVIDNYYDKDNPEKVTLNQLKSIKSNLL